MRYKEINPTLRAFIGNREAFRKLGFSADDLFCSISMSVRHSALSCFVKLKLKNKSSDFNMEVGPVKDGGAFERENTSSSLSPSTTGTYLKRTSIECGKKASATRTRKGSWRPSCRKVSTHPKRKTRGHHLD